MAGKRWGLTPDEGQGQGLRVENVRRGSPAARLGLEPGDVILKIQEIPLDSLDDYVEAVQRYRLNNSVILVVARNGRMHHVRMRI